MKIITNITIIIKPGDGGCGSTSFFGRYKAVFDGGDGGVGGDVILRCSDQYETLNHITQFKFCATSGNNGSRNKKKGRSGKDVIVILSRQCLVKLQKPSDTHYILYELNNKSKDLIFNGSIGGKGSVNTKSKSILDCLPKYSDEYILYIQSLFDSNSIAVIFFPHFHVFNLKKIDILKYSGEHQLSVRFFKNMKFYIFLYFFKNIINFINNFKLVIFVYHNNNHLEEIKNLLNQNNNHILFLNINKFLFFMCHY